MYSEEVYKNLKQKYGGYSSWTIWNEEDVHDTSIIDRSFHELNSKFVILGLNISGVLSEKSWTNFHDNTHSRKIRYSCNHTELRGCYITDIFKDYPEANSLKLRKEISEDLIHQNVEFFKQEMKDIEIDEKTIFIVLGGLTKDYFNRYFKSHFANKVIYFDHYSAYAKYTDKGYAEEFLKTVRAILY